MDEATIKQFTELQAQLEDAYVTIDILNEYLAERDEQLRMAKAQIQALRNAQNVDYRVA